VLPPESLEPVEAALLLDRLAELLVHAAHVGRGQGLGVAHRRHSEEIGRQLRTLGVEDERAAHAEGSAEETRLENDVVTRRCLGRGAGIGGAARPVVLREDERGEVDLPRQLHQPVEGRDARVEDRGPRLDLGDLREAARQGLEQLRLLAG